MEAAFTNPRREMDPSSFMHGIIEINLASRTIH
jgi:hypothetical protein